MDELEISGKRYISTARAAKEHKYHADYIGQLVRGGKVVGQKVGRSWYVDEESLNEYLTKEVPARGPKQAPVETAVPTPAPIKEVLEPVQPLELVIEKVEVQEIVQPKEEKEEEKEEIKEIVDDVFARFTRRPHVIMPLSEQAVVDPVKEEPPFVTEEAQKVEEEVVAAPEEDVTMPRAAEEVFVPIKLERLPRQVPEDSFYKIPRKGLQYIASRTKHDVVAPMPAYAGIPMNAPGTAHMHTTSLQREKAHARYGIRVAALASLIFIAGIVSLGGGVILAYYLHSSTVVSAGSQVSGLIFSQN